MTAIKTITTHKLDYMNAKPVADFTDVLPVISSFVEFDKEGHSLTEISYLANGSIEQKFEFNYNGKGQLIGEVLINEEGFIDEKKSFEYNENGQMVKEFLFYQDESFDTTQLGYNDEGKLVEKLTIDTDGIVEEKKEYLYQNSLLIKETHYDGEGNILSEIDIMYDEKGNEIEIKHFIAEDDKRSRTEFEYDENGKRTVAYAYNAKDELIAKNHYKEDEKGQVTEIVEEDQFNKNLTIIEYDDKGNMISQLETNAAGELNQRILRKFDNNMNLMEVAVTMDKHGAGLNQNYVIQYSYEYFD